MRLGLRELRRRPGRFVPVGGALTLLVLLLLVLGGFLDGLTLGQTGSYRAQGDRLFVLDENADLQLPRSRVGPDVRTAVADVPGVAAVGAVTSTTTTAGILGADELQDVVVLGYELGTPVLPDPPPPGAAVVDRRLARLAELAVGDVLAVGPTALEVEVVELVDDVSQGSPTLWVATETWRRVAEAASARGAPPEGQAAALVVEPEAGTDTAELVTPLQEAAPVTAATVDEVVEALDVVQQQASTFEGILGVTFLVTLLVVALFFALLTLERVRLYAVFKAVGARTRDLAAGVAVQAVTVAAVALLVGGALALAFVALLPPTLPVQLEAGRAVQVAGGTLVTALVGSLFTLRRLVRVDPARAIG